MLQSKLIGETFKEWPNEATLKSHGLLIKGGYIRQIAGGIYTLLPLAKKVVTKIENIIREEMNNLEAQEILMPLVSTRKLWDMSGRYETVDQELVRFKDRTGADLVLSMTHEEVVTYLALTDAKSYQKYPFSLYQIQTKFRDEARSRGGLIRVREFTMKDAYSFHTSKESLKETYKQYYDAYNTIFKRVGIPEVIAVESDTGMMGGEVAHEYMLLCDAGEDKIITCTNCDYMANMEVAKTGKIEQATFDEIALEKFETPGIKTIEDLQSFVTKDANQMIKAVVYTRMDTKEPVIVFIRADREVNETKLKKAIKVEELEPRKEQLNDGICYGSIGPVNLNAKNVTVVYDISLKNETNLICGANEDGYHLKGVNLKRDVQDAHFVDIYKVIEGDICPVCSKNTIAISKGIEVGNIFQIEQKYTKSMNITYLDENGKSQFPIMGCYGIGVGRLMASVLEAKATKKATNWPVSIAPFDIHICPIDYAKSDVVKMYSDKVYKELKNLKFDVLLDDRAKSPGVKFADADLIGAPIRICLSPRNLPNNLVEVKVVGEEEAQLVNLDKLYEYIDEKRKILLEGVK
jgi:prolyl-tRNA synthetase